MRLNLEGTPAGEICWGSVDFAPESPISYRPPRRDGCGGVFRACWLLGPYPVHHDSYQLSSVLLRVVNPLVDSYCAIEGIRLEC